ncbi:MAG: DUF4328 domain-containing protein [Acidobacteriota bacterium]
MSTTLPTGLEAPPQAFVSPATRMWVTIPLLVLQSIFIVFAAAANLGALIAFAGWFPGTSAEGFETAALFAEIFTLVFLALTGIAFISWHRRLIRNLPAVGCPAPDPSIVWATWAWLLPIVNLFVPYRSFQQIARNARTASARRPTGLVDAWWLAWIASIVADATSAVLMRIPEGPTRRVLEAGSTLAGNGAELLAAGLALALLVVLTRGQEREAAIVAAERRAWVTDPSGVTPPPSMPQVASPPALARPPRETTGETSQDP